MKRKVPLVVVVLVFACLATTMVAAEQGLSTKLAGKPSETYYMISFWAGNEYWAGCYKGFSDAAALYGVKTQYGGTMAGDVNDEATKLEEMLSMNPAGVAVASVNAQGMESSIKKGIDAGIPIISFDADSTLASGRLAFIGTGNYNAGCAAARALGKVLGGKGDVGLLRYKETDSCFQRGEGFLATIAKEFPGIHFVTEVNSKIDQAEAAKGVAAMLQGHPSITGIFCTESAGGVGAGTVVKEQGKAGKVKIVSFDTDVGTLDMVKEGTITATVAQSTYVMGFWAFQMLYAYKHGLAVPFKSYDKAGSPPIPLVTDTGYTIVTQNNVQYFYNRY